jgi:hypothetical protein
MWRWKWLVWLSEFQKQEVIDKVNKAKENKIPYTFKEILFLIKQYYDKMSKM